MSRKFSRNQFIKLFGIYTYNRLSKDELQYYKYIHTLDLIDVYFKPTDESGDKGTVIYLVGDPSVFIGKDGEVAKGFVKFIRRLGYSFQVDVRLHDLPKYKHLLHVSVVSKSE